MARAADQFRGADVTLWGIIALICWGGAVLAANLSALVPDSMFASLHASHLGGNSLVQMRAELTGLAEETSRLQQDNALLQQRFEIAEQVNGEVTRRVGALEVSLPDLVEQLPKGAMIDPSTTASIPQVRPLTFDAKGGSVSVTNTPLAPVAEAAPADPDAAISLIPKAYGVALGRPLDPLDADAEWQNLAGKVGALLIGLSPLLEDAKGATTQRIVAGPITDQAQAAELCIRLDRVGIACEAVPFAGAPLPLMN